MRRWTIGMMLAAGFVGSGAAAQAYEIRVRFSTGTIVTPVEPPLDPVIIISPGGSRRIRIQMGVFDDDAGPAPPGGFIGWNVGTLTMTGGTNTRTPGRLAPWNFAPDPPGNGLPSIDPFTALTGIDATLGTQFPPWLCNPDGTIPPQPPPVIRGLNTFVSLFEFTTVAGTSDYTAVFGGHQIVASGWGTIGTPTPPDCSNPNNPIPGSVLYAPMTLPPIPFTVTLHIVVPAPGAAWVLGIAGLGVLRRRRAGFTAESTEITEEGRGKNGDG